MSQYLFDNAAPQSARRFCSLETLYDPGTIHYLEALGIGVGWQCLEVGGGSGSIAVWLAQRVGATGQVLVTDIDPRPLAAVAALGYPQLTVLRHDIGGDPLPEGAYDLVHERLVLIHVPTREQALTKLVAALKPGGWLVVEDFDSTLIHRSFPTQDAAAGVLYEKMQAAQRHLIAARAGNAGNATWGRQLYARLRMQGLSEVGMEGHLAIWSGGSEGARLDQANFEQIRAEAVASGLITGHEVDQVLALLDNPTFVVSSSVMMTAWGRRPAERDTARDETGGATAEESVSALSARMG
jgi:ubiquinone/menaquinone biosynthesis C-methylase UbiE